MERSPLGVSRGSYSWAGLSGRPPSLVIIKSSSLPALRLPEIELLQSLIGRDRSSGTCLFNFPPQGYVIFRRIDIVPIHKPVRRRIVELIIKDGPPPVFNGIFDSSKRDNDNQGD